MQLLTTGADMKVVNILDIICALKQIIVLLGNALTREDFTAFVCFSRESAVRYRYFNMP